MRSGASRARIRAANGVVATKRSCGALPSPAPHWYRPPTTRKRRLAASASTTKNADHRALLQVDKAAPEDQATVWSQRKRREDPAPGRPDRPNCSWWCTGSSRPVGKLVCAAERTAQHAVPAARHRDASASTTTAAKKRDETSSVRTISLIYMRISNPTAVGLRRDDGQGSV